MSTWTSAVSWARKAAGAGEVDDAGAAGVAEEMLRAVADADAPPASRPMIGGGETRDADAPFQSLCDAAYLVAAVGGEGVPERRARIAAALAQLHGSEDAAKIDDRLESARVFVHEHGAVALSDRLAKSVTDNDARAAILTLASAMAMLGGGDGNKVAVALQAIARAFGTPLADLQKYITAGRIG
jgi:hypothetical protein